MNNLKINQRVRDIKHQYSGLTFGYVKAIDEENQKAWVYWPQIKSGGQWPISMLEAL